MSTKLIEKLLSGVNVVFATALTYLMSFVKQIKSEISAISQMKKDKQDIKDYLAKTLLKGKLTDKEVNTLHEKMRSANISFNNINDLKLWAYNIAFSSVKQNSLITYEHEDNLNNIQMVLHINNHEIAESKKELEKLRTISDIKLGNLPAFVVDGFLPQRNEIVHWSESAWLMEEVTLGRRYEGGSSGISVRVAKGVTIRAGSSRGRVIVDKSIEKTSFGSFIITNKRFVFNGDSKSFSIKYEKMIGLQLNDNWLTINSETGKQKEIQFTTSENSEIILAIINAAAANAVA